MEWDMSTLSFSHCATAAPTVLMGAVESLLFDSSVWMWTQCSPTAGISPWFDYSQSCGQSDKSQHLSHLFSSGMWLSASSYWHQQSLHFSFRILSVLHTLQHHTNPKISGEWWNSHEISSTDRNGLSRAHLLAQCVAQQTSIELFTEIKRRQS